MLQKNIVAALLILIGILVSPVYAANEKVQLTSYYPIPYGQYTNLNSAGDTYFATSSGNVGIGMDTGATVKLEVPINTAIKVGDAYLSTGSSPRARLGYAAWYNGTAWVETAAGVLLQLTDTNAIVYYHNGSGTLTAWATVNSTAGWAAGCAQVLKQNIHTLTFADYALLREQFQATDVFSYNRKDTPTEPEVGFIAEHAPDLVLNKDKTGIPLIKGIGYLAAILKAQENVLLPLEREVQDLKREALAFEARQRQIEALQKDVEGLREKLKRLKEKTGKV